jgi:predicted secreted acid phosphatase
MNDALVQLRGLKTSAHDVVVLDVDETTIANLPHVLSMDFGFRLDIWNAWVKEAKAKAIPQVKRFYDTLVAKGIKVIFLTGRMDEFAAATKTNLVSQGYTVYDTIITRFTGDGFQSTGSFKTATRKKIEENGYHIIMCIGDQESDLQGGHTGIKVKLPDFLYIIE